VSLSYLNLYAGGFDGWGFGVGFYDKGRFSSGMANKEKAGPSLRSG
jgi:hypothetical protein